MFQELAANALMGLPPRMQRTKRVGRHGWGQNLHGLAVPLLLRRQAGNLWAPPHRETGGLGGAVPLGPRGGRRLLGGDADRSSVGGRWPREGKDLAQHRDKEAPCILEVRKEPQAAVQRLGGGWASGPHRGAVHPPARLGDAWSLGALVCGVVVPVVVHDAPRPQARTPAERGERLAHVHKLQGSPRSPQELSDDGLVLNGVEAAGGVGHEAADLEQRRAAHRNLQLGHVEAAPVVGPPRGPALGVLPQRPVPRAGHVAQHPVVLAGGVPVRAKAVADCALHRRSGVGEALRAVCRDHQPARGEPEGRAPPHQEVSARRARVVGDDDARRRIDPFTGPTTVAWPRVEGLEQLCRLGARGGAEVEAAVGRLDAEQRRRDHGHDLLTGEEAGARVLREPFLQRPLRFGPEEAERFVGSGPEGRGGGWPGGICPTVGEGGERRTDGEPRQRRGAVLAGRGVVGDPEGGAAVWEGREGGSKRGRGRTWGGRARARGRRQAEGGGATGNRDGKVRGES
eukprot:CAMPEP_0177603846 /NCGR_PEP_ID=MMETSP0419_2-20121207/15760_1 /TAXON_ID=582737 /ORGANISM="Tetraselmis sp., Strain GSL018" /LENGTH=512 /DNA_ID=CAMNT_0019097705 /DNA_START=678 /DNA_END=2213 /DNA_ORIENTATION=-